MGGAVYNALSLGVAVILSDIDVNKEINNNSIMFFKAGDENDLAEKMKIRYSIGKEFKTRDLLLSRSAEVVNELKKYMFKEVSELLGESHMMN